MERAWDPNLKVGENERLDTYEKSQSLELVPFLKRIGFGCCIQARGILDDMPTEATKSNCRNSWFMRFQSVLFPSLLILLVSIAAFPRVSNKALADVKRIFIESFPTSTRATQIYDLRKELIANGFEVVEERSQADAVLSWESQAEIVLHGDGSIPDKSIFTWRLLVADKPIWKHTTKFVSKKTPDDDLAYAAQKLAKLLFEDKAKAIKKGA